MQIEMKSSFAKAMKKITQPKLASEVYNIISEIQSAKKLSEIENVRKLKGAKNAYRIKLSEHSDFRIGFILEKNVIYLVVFASRKEIYRAFP
jgi:mRNA interferase RelE/StbE